MPRWAAVDRFAADVETVLLIEQVPRGQRHADGTTAPRCRRVHQRVAVDLEGVVFAAEGSLMCLMARVKSMEGLGLTRAPQFTMYSIVRDGREPQQLARERSSVPRADHLKGF